MKSLWIFLFLFGVAFAAPKRTFPPKRGGKIVGGDERPIEDLPYHLQLDQTFLGFFTYSCGAVIVGPNSFLTAAHCLEDIFDGGQVDVRVLSGSNMLDEGKIHSVVDRTTHPDYSNEDDIFVYDIAFCTVSPPFKFDNTTRAVPIAQNPAKVGDVATVSGWGATMENPGGSNWLVSVEVPILDQLDCKSYYEQYGYDSNGSFCAGQPLYHKDFCSEDEGGPLVLNGELVGIASVREDCENIFNPGIYTNVTAVASWINDQLIIAEKKLNQSPVTIN